MGSLFNSFKPQVVFQEVPDEVSLAFTITGCPLRCEGCHSMDSWDPHNGEALTVERFTGFLELYRGLISCVLFFGGEWQSEYLIRLLQKAQNLGLKTCLYSGKEKIPTRIRKHLTYLKVGSWQPLVGGLDSHTTNQKFINLTNQKLLNFKFIGVQHGYS